MDEQNLSATVQIETTAETGRSVANWFGESPRLAQPWNQQGIPPARTRCGLADDGSGRMRSSTLWSCWWGMPAAGNALRRRTANGCNPSRPRKWACSGGRRSRTARH